MDAITIAVDIIFVPAHGGGREKYGDIYKKAAISPIGDAISYVYS